MKKKDTILYVQTSDQPERQYSPLILAQNAFMMNIKPIVYYLGQGIKILRPPEAEKIQIGTFPKVAELIKQTLTMGIDIYVCEASKQLLGLEHVQFISGVQIVGATTLNDLALEAKATMWF